MCEKQYKLETESMNMMIEEIIYRIRISPTYEEAEQKIKRTLRDYGIVSDIQEKTLYTWQEIYEQAVGSECNSDELAAKDEARWQLSMLIEEETGKDIEEEESPEDSIFEYLEGRDVEVMFDEYGNIVKK